MKKIIKVLLCISSILVLLLVGCENKQTSSNVSKNNNAMIEVKDDSGKTINIDKPAKRIISLYSAHTENLFSLGLDKEVIGVGTSDAYPYKVLEKKRYSYRDDAESVIAAKPDLVLIRPFIERGHPDFVKSLRDAGIAVASFYPTKLSEFDNYIKRLAKLTGKEKKATELLNDFHKQLKEAEEKSKKISKKVKIYFESTETNCRTVTLDSMAGEAIRISGGINIASDAKSIKGKKTSIASYGTEKVLAKSKEIDVYVAQRGSMNAGGNPHSISIRPGFSQIKAVKNKRVYNIDEKLVSSPTFRYIKGIYELQRMFYPEVFDDISSFNNNKEITREELAKIVIMVKHKNIFTPTSRYYKKKIKGHKYGEFKDVNLDNINFDYIETAVLSGYIESKKDEYNPNGKVTKEELAKTLYLLKDLTMKQVSISDLDQCSNKSIIQTVVGNNILQLENGKFNPKRNVTQKEVLESVKKLNLNK
ncbi:ABC transporter substrate-binding protein [Haloimpatiens sp. FM7330]|uniref:ABC transporter substrate-binding protein n=1 Tax=Haloimpatiens sp. FM7330 TaxID=3298610 RepID=UPI0036431B69